MGAWDHEGEFTWDEDEGVESEQGKSVLQRWRVLNLMRPPGMTQAYFRILSVIAQQVPPGRELWKGRPQLVEEADVGEKTLDRFFLWSYEKGVNLLGRRKGRRGFSDKVRPNYRAWVDHAVPTVQRMADGERKDRAAGHLEEFALAIGKDGTWARQFRESLYAGRAKTTPGRAKTALPQGQDGPTSRAKSTLGVGPRWPSKRESLTGSLTEAGTEGENGPEPEQAPLRASPSSSSHEKEQRPKSATKAERQRREHARLFFEREATMGQGLRTWEHWEAYFPPQYDRQMLREVFEEVARKVNGGDDA